MACHTPKLIKVIDIDIDTASMDGFSAAARWPGDVLQSWSTVYHELYQLYKDDKFDQCIESAADLLGYLEKPCFYRMKILIVLSACLEDETETDDAWLQARDRRTGTDPKIEESLVEIRASIGSLQQQHLEEREEI